MAHHSRRRRSTRYRRNPRRGGGGGGGSNLGLYLLIGGGAYLLMSGGLGRIGSIFGGSGPAVAGYTPLGGNTYRNNATGQVVTRDPSTGNMVTAQGGVIPAGTPAWLAPTVQVGAAAIPQIGVGLAQGLVGALTGGIRALFNPSAPSTPATPAPSSVPTPEAPGPGYIPTLPPDVAMTTSEIPVPDLAGAGYVPPSVPTLDLSLVPATPTIDTSSGFDAGTWF